MGNFMCGKPSLDEHDRKKLSEKYLNYILI